MTEACSQNVGKGFQFQVGKRKFFSFMQEPREMTCFTVQVLHTFIHFPILLFICHLHHFFDKYDCMSKIRTKDGARRAARTAAGALEC